MTDNTKSSNGPRMDLIVHIQSKFVHEQDPMLVLNILSTFVVCTGDRKTPKLDGHESANELSENPILLDKLLANMVVFVTRRLVGFQTRNTTKSVSETTKSSACSISSNSLLTDRLI